MTDGLERELSSSTLMLLAARAAEDRVFQALADAGFDDLTRAQGRLLAGIDLEGTRLLILAERARVAKQTAVALVDRLEENGYVERTRDPRDGRARLVRLTSKGLAMIPHARAAEAAVEQEWARHLGARDAVHLHALLARLRPAVDPR